MDARNSELELVRDFSAPRSLVFECWTTAAHLEKWFGPIGFTTTCTMDFRRGGKVSITLSGHGMVHTVHGVYREIVPDEKIELGLRFEDIPDHEMIQTITFADAGRADRTRVTVRHRFPAWDTLSPRERALMEPRGGGAREGWTQTLQHLADYIATRTKA
jgi:uncharacterized protein YndB with AHSA1/START domain